MVSRLLFLFVTFSASAVYAQFYPQLSSGEIRLKLEKLNTLGSVLYIAAHPDDENTLAIGYYANERKMTTAYLSLTRGDGGQNLIGGELRDKLGLIRTRELLEARKIDGGIQFFTRANDFGFSKGPEETLSVWDKNEILHDVLKVVRSFKPDIIICRFPPDSRAGHGHHTSSALLALEAFEKSGDPSVFPEQVAQYGAWKPRRVFLNLSRFFNQNLNEKTPGVITIDMGGYNPLLGVSYPELSAASRSMHKSQGFGSRARRGYTPEFFELQRGDSVKNDLLEGINTSWSRVNGGKKIEILIKKVIAKFNDDQPWLSVPALLNIRTQINLLEPGIWKKRKIDEVNRLITDCLGLYAEVTADHYYQSPDGKAELSVEIQNRSKLDISLISLALPELKSDSLINSELKAGGQLLFQLKKKIPSDLEYSPPYWLKEKHSPGLFTVADRSKIGMPENNAALNGIFKFRIADQLLEISVPVLFKSTDPVRGEIYRPVEITPPVSLESSQSAELFPTAGVKRIRLNIRSLIPAQNQGIIRLNVPAGWKVTPQQIPFSLDKKGQVRVVEIEVTPPQEESEGMLNISAEINGRFYNAAVEEIAYDHIPVQTLQNPADIKLIRTDIRIEAKKIGYIQGAGDDIPASLRSLGIDVTELKNEEISTQLLSGFDAVVLGIRALNTNDNIRAIMPDLLKYCEAGGTLITQYNTNGDLQTDQFSPFGLTISRERVTQENSPVKILAAAHPVLNFPNRISDRDFEGWVQERGLYFPGKWDPAFTPVLSMNDAGEPERKGSLLVAKHGNGYYVYTGLSFFRQLPEGVTGAFRLFTNLLSLKNAPK